MCVCVCACAGPVLLSQPVDAALKGTYVPSTNTSSLLLFTEVVACALQGNTPLAERAVEVLHSESRLLLPMEGVVDALQGGVHLAQERCNWPCTHSCLPAGFCLQAARWGSQHVLQATLG